MEVQNELAASDSRIDESWKFKKSAVERECNGKARHTFQALYKKSPFNTIVDTDPSWKRRLSELLRVSKERRQELHMKMREIHEEDLQRESLSPRVKGRRRSIRDLNNNVRRRKFSSEVKFNKTSSQRPPWNWRAGVKPYWEMNKMFPPVENMGKIKHTGPKPWKNWRSTRTIFMFKGSNETRPATRTGFSSGMKGDQTTSNK